MVVAASICLAASGALAQSGSVDKAVGGYVAKLQAYRATTGLEAVKMLLNKSEPTDFLQLSFL
jgi:hypothetical protein